MNPQNEGAVAADLEAIGLKLNPKDPNVVHAHFLWKAMQIGIDGDVLAEGKDDFVELSFTGDQFEDEFNIVDEDLKRATFKVGVALKSNKRFGIYPHKTLYCGGDFKKLWNAWNGHSSRYFTASFSGHDNPKAKAAGMSEEITKIPVMIILQLAKAVSEAEARVVQGAYSIAFTSASTMNIIPVMKHRLPTGENAVRVSRVSFYSQQPVGRLPDNISLLEGYCIRTGVFAGGLGMNRGHLSNFENAKFNALSRRRVRLLDIGAEDACRISQDVGKRIGLVDTIELISEFLQEAVTDTKSKRYALCPADIETPPLTKDQAPLTRLEQEFHVLLASVFAESSAVSLPTEMVEDTEKVDVEE